MKIKSIIVEEVKRLFQQRLYGIQELAKFLSEHGHDNCLETLTLAYKRDGDQGIIDTYTNITGLEIEAASNGKYIFANLYDPEGNKVKSVT